MKVHPRTLLVQQVSAEVGLAILAVLEKHELTYIEIIKILNEQQASCLKYALRAERHPDDPDKPADRE